MSLNRFVSIDDYNKLSLAYRELQNKYNLLQTTDQKVLNDYEQNIRDTNKLALQAIYKDIKLFYSRLDTLKLHLKYNSPNSNYARRIFDLSMKGEKQDRNFQIEINKKKFLYSRELEDQNKIWAVLLEEANNLIKEYEAYIELGKVQKIELQTGNKENYHFNTNISNITLNEKVSIPKFLQMFKKIDKDEMEKSKRLVNSIANNKPYISTNTSSEDTSTYTSIGDRVKTNKRF